MAFEDDYSQGIEAAIIAAGQIQTRAKTVVMLAEDFHNEVALAFAQSAVDASELSMENFQSAILFIQEADKTEHLSKQASASLQFSEAELGRAEHALGLRA